jgi:hypothetical protein
MNTSRMMTMKRFVSLTERYLQTARRRAARGLLVVKEPHFR